MNESQSINRIEVKATLLLLLCRLFLTGTDVYTHPDEDKRGFWCTQAAITHIVFDVRKGNQWRWSAKGLGPGPGACPIINE